MPLATGLATFDEAGLVFDYPASWRAFDYEDVSSFTTLLRYLGTVDVPAPCTTTNFPDHSSTVCQANYRLVPNSVVVTVEADASPRFDILDIPPGAQPRVMGGLPGYQLILTPGPFPETGVETTIRTVLSRPGSTDNYFNIAAAIRGPDSGSLRRDIDALIASVRFDPPVVMLDSSAGGAAKAAAKALTILGQDSPAWGCFIPVGVHELVIDTLPNGPALARPQLARCTSKVEPTALQMWRMTLTMQLSERDPLAGLGETTVLWVHPDGTPGSMSATAMP